MSLIHWVARGTGTPKDRDEVNRRDVCECDGTLGDSVFEIPKKIPEMFSGRFLFVYYESIK